MAKLRNLLVAAVMTALGCSMPEAESIASEHAANMPGTTEWQGISASLIQLRDALAAGRSTDDVRSAYSRALTALQAESRKAAIQPPINFTSQSPLRSSWALEGKRTP